ncbi:MAG: hypothetical protein JXJ20_06545 [Anaerolineae bacterium]|nr:hypothetical protein [Anaerolineae bacterium]
MYLKPLVRYAALGACWLLATAGCTPTGTPSPPPPNATPSPSPVPTPTATAVVMPTPADSQTAAAPLERVITLNTPAEVVYIPGQTREVYVFDSDRARRVGVLFEATDGGPSPRLAARLYDSEGEIVPHADASAGQPMLRDEWDLPGPGRYTLLVFGAESQSRALRLTVIARPLPESGGGTIAYGESHSGEIAARGQRDEWVFQGQAGDHVLITMTTPASDGYLELYEPAGRLVTTNDDSYLGHNPSLDVVLPATGEYTIVARMFDDDQTGAYRLALDRIE